VSALSVKVTTGETFKPISQAEFVLYSK